MTGPVLALLRDGHADDPAGGRTGHRRETLVSSLSGNAARSLAIGCIVQATNLCTGVILARSLGPEDRGRLAVMLLWPSIAIAFGTLGVTEATTWCVARCTTDRGRILGTVAAVCAAQSALLSVSCVALYSAVGADRAASHVDAAGWFIPAFIAVHVPTTYAVAYVAGAGWLRAFQTLRLFTVLATAIGLVLLLAQGEVTIRGAGAVYVAASLATCVGAAVVIARRTRGPLRVDRVLAKELFRFGLRGTIGTLAAAASERLAQALVAVSLGPVGLGLFVVASSGSAAVQSAGASISLVTFPTVAASTGGERRAAARRAVAITAISSLSVATPLVVFMPALIRLFFGDAFAGAVDAARVLVVGGVVWSVVRVAGTVLRGSGHPLAASSSEVAALVVGAAALGLLIPLWGLSGAAVSSVLAATTAAGCLGLFARSLARRGERPALTPATALSPNSSRARESG